MTNDNANVVHREYKVTQPHVIFFLKLQNEVLLNSIYHSQMFSVSAVIQPEQTEFARELFESSTPI